MAGGRLLRRGAGDLEDQRAGADAAAGGARQRQPRLIARDRPGRPLRVAAFRHDVQARVAAMHDPDVVLRVDGHADRLAEHPVIRQRLRPERIDLEGRRLHAGGALGRGDAFERAARDEQRGDEHEEESPENGMTRGSHVRPGTRRQILKLPWAGRSGPGAVVQCLDCSLLMNTVKFYT